jgi:hypothetical protein
LQLQLETDTRRGSPCEPLHADVPIACSRRELLRILTGFLEVAAVEDDIGRRPRPQLHRWWLRGWADRLLVPRNLTERQAAGRNQGS